MTERAFSFNTRMVEAILGERKTVTRQLGRKAPVAVGDVIRVPEAHFLGPTGAWKAASVINPHDSGEACYYRAGWNGPAPGRPPSIHMPRWAARILLEVTSVEEERLRDIAEVRSLKQKRRRTFATLRRRAG